MTKKRCNKIGLVLVLMFLFSIAVQADNLSFFGLNTNLGASMQISTSKGTVWAGSLAIRYNDHNYLAYCVDLYETVYVPGSYTGYTPRSMDELPYTPEVNPLYVNADTGLRVAWLLNNQALTGSFNAKQQAAGLQAAIWEVLYDWNANNTSQNGLNIYQGNFFVNTSTDNKVEEAAIQYLTNLGSNTSSQGTWFDGSQAYNSNYGRGFQSVAISQTVPEPASLFLLGTGLFGLAAGTRLRRVKK